MWNTLGRPLLEFKFVAQHIVNCAQRKTSSAWQNSLTDCVVFLQNGLDLFQFLRGHFGEPSSGFLDRKISNTSSKLAVPPPHSAQTERILTMNLQEFSVCLRNTFSLNMENVDFCTLGQLTVFHLARKRTQKHSRNCANNKQDAHRLTGRHKQWIGKYLGQTDWPKYGLVMCTGGTTGAEEHVQKWRKSVHSHCRKKWMFIWKYTNLVDARVAHVLLCRLRMCKSIQILNDFVLLYSYDKRVYTSCNG